MLDRYTCLKLVEGMTTERGVCNGRNSGTGVEDVSYYANVCRQHISGLLGGQNMRAVGTYRLGGKS
jgi:hypothetical protein